MFTKTAALRRIFPFFIFCLLIISIFSLQDAPAALPSSALSNGTVADGKKIVVMLDPGHGGRDPGTGEGSRDESYYTLKVAQYCKAALEANGNFQVYMTREDNMGGTASLSLMERGMAANAVNADLLVSCHFDGSTNSSAAGLSAYVSVVPRYQKWSLAGKMLEKLNAATGLGIFKQGVNAVTDYGDTLYYWSDELNWSLPNRPETGPLRDYYGVIKWSAYFGIPSIIVEHGFLSNPGNRAIIEKEETLKALGEADAAAIIEYYTGHTHNFSAAERDFPSNCMVTGKDSARCTVCGCRQDTTSRAPAEDGHIWLESKRVSPGCVSEGYVEYTCEITRAMNVGKEGWCKNHTYKETLSALGHSYEVVSSLAAGHGKDGYKTYKCTRCGEGYTETLPGEPHSFKLRETVIAGCENPGVDISACTVCGLEQRVQTAPATGHDDALFSETAPACETVGVRVYRCTACARERKEELPAPGHTGGDPFLREATCTVEGEQGYICAVCGKEVTVEVLPLAPHSYAEEPLEETLPDCVTAGLRRYRCTVCEQEREEELPALGHTEGESYQRELTCTEDGEQGYICATCGETVILETLPAAGHTYEETRREEPDCVTVGIGVFVCTVCGDEQTENLPPLGHDFAGEDKPCLRCGLTMAEAAALETGDGTGETVSDPGGSSGDGGEGSDVAAYLREHLLLLVLIFGGVLLLSGGFVIYFTGKKTRRVLMLMREDELAAKDEFAAAEEKIREAAAIATAESADASEEDEENKEETAGNAVERESEADPAAETAPEESGQALEETETFADSESEQTTSVL